MFSVFSSFAHPFNLQIFIKVLQYDFYFFGLACGGPPFLLATSTHGKIATERGGDINENE